VQSWRVKCAIIWVNEVRERAADAESKLRQTADAMAIVFRAQGANRRKETEAEAKRLEAVGQPRAAAAARAPALNDLGTGKPYAVLVKELSQPTKPRRLRQQEKKVLEMLLGGGSAGASVYAPVRSLRMK
jgi:hypothetical protein